jgi:hypothetical protein
MLRDRRLTHASPLSQFPHGEGPVPESLKERPTRRIGKRGERCIIGHYLYSLLPIDVSRQRRIIAARSLAGDDRVAAQTASDGAIAARVAYGDGLNRPEGRVAAQGSMPDGLGGMQRAPRRA